MSRNARTIGTAASLSRVATDTNTSPSDGRNALAAICALANAIGRLSSMPITSPVDFISGPRMMSTPANLLNGNTLSFTE